MNKIRLLGIVILLLGISLFMIYDHDVVDFIFGFMLTVGVVLTIAGSFKHKSKI